MSVSMTAKKGFTNSRVAGPRPDGSVSPGESFSTDWVHGKELRQLGLAEPDDEKAFDDEPHEMMRPHNQISEPELRRVNARRTARASAIGATGGTGSTGSTSLMETGTTGATGQAVTGDMLRPHADSASSVVKSNGPPIPPAPGATGTSV